MPIGAFQYLQNPAYTGGYTPTTPTGQSGYNVTPSPYGYSSTFGGVPGSIGLPNPYQDLSSVYPNLSGTNAAASQALLSELSGQVSPETQALLQDKSAQFGVSSGMPGSGLARNQGLRNLGLTSEQLQQQGLQQYGNLISAVSGTQTVNPALQAEIAARNAQSLAAPIPAQAQSYAQSLFDKYLNSLRSPAGGSGAISSPTAGTGSSPFVGGTPSPAYPGQIDPNALANTWSSGPSGDQSLQDWMNQSSWADTGFGGVAPDYSAPTDYGSLADYVNQPYDVSGGF